MGIQDKAFKEWFAQYENNIEYASEDIAWDAWQAAKAQAVPKCTWLQNEDGYFDTSCRQSFVFTEPEDKPHDHRFTHCCFCGGRLIEAQGASQ